MSYPKIIIVVSHLPIVTAAVVAIVLYKRLGETGRAFTWFLLFSCLIQLASLVLWFRQTNNMPLLHVYVPVGFALLALFFSRLLAGTINSGIIRTTVIVFVLFSVNCSIFYQPVLTFNSGALTVEAILVIILSIFTFIVQLNLAARPAEMRRWVGISQINSGLFIYYVSTLLLFYFGSDIMRWYSVDISAYTWVFHSFFSMVMYCCFIAGIWKQAAAYH